MGSAGQVEVRAAWIGFRGVLLGALIGAIGPGLGVYFTYQGQVDERLNERREVIYSDFAAEANSLRNELALLEVAAYRGDSAEYHNAFTEYWSQYSQKFYPTYIRAYILAEDPEIITDVRAPLLEVATERGEAGQERGDQVDAAGEALNIALYDLANALREEVHGDP